MPARASGRWVPPQADREAIAGRLAALASDMTSAALADMAQEHPWFSALDAEHRSWITLVVQSGVDGFVNWFADRESPDSPTNIFATAPRSLMRHISLQHTVELIRSTVTTVEKQISELVPPEDQAVLEAAIVQYSREVAFDAAAVYAHAAEIRGAWDARLEAQVLDSVLRGEADDDVLLRASTLGWGTPTGVAVVIGDLHPSTSRVEELRSLAGRQGFDLMLAPQGDRLFVVLGGDFTNESQVLAAVESLADCFGPGPVIVGPLCASLAEVTTSARAALAGRRAAAGWPDAPRAVAARWLLPERALSGDGHARRELVRQLYVPLAEHSGELLETLEAFFAENGSIEATARRLFIHANTVRYRLGKVIDVTGYSPHNARDAYALRLALSLGRLTSARA